MERMMSGLAILFLAASAAFEPAAAQQFSAEMLGDNNGNQQREKVYVSDSKLRIEPQGHVGEVIIIDANANTVLMLMSAQKMYMELPNSGRMVSVFRPVDVNNACPQWRDMMKEKDDEWSCRKIGSETVNGRQAIKYEGKSSTRGTGYAWIDPKLKFMIKLAGEHGGMELQNIAEGPQPAELFTVPADFHKMDMQQMMRGRAPQQ